MDRSSWIRWIAVGTLGALVVFLALKKMRDVMPHMMAKMMQQCMRQIATGDTMHEMMPKMMETCLGPMSRDERKRMLTFCQTMLKEMEEKYT